MLVIKLITERLPLEELVIDSSSVLTYDEATSFTYVVNLLSMNPRRLILSEEAIPRLNSLLLLENLNLIIPYTALEVEKITDGAAFSLLEKIKKIKPNLFNLNLPLETLVRGYRPLFKPEDVTRLQYFKFLKKER